MLLTLGACPESNGQVFTESLPSPTSTVVTGRSSAEIVEVEAESKTIDLDALHQSSKSYACVLHMWLIVRTQI